MKMTVDQQGESRVAIIESDEIVIANVQDALDLMATVSYHEDCYKMLIRKSNINEDFFELKTKLAGDILQKYTNYKVKLAIVGDFESYDSKSLKDFIYESNNGKQVFFAKDIPSALQALHQAE
ncbi:hypothetical protein FHS16_006317 [Paenibacillus endophyticus]|uniref:DUF4180 domain-containing protein n=1 Tax=Paenibacillus endophyticus TaxID=1294268 RepID=A0A7W5CFA6_9BACL|nr:DUF4180 domain-containing protein [Paenibacillus endophyticus]MBB3156195.1 hypothetical protein [Paenibacillus endophyticus]